MKGFLFAIATIAVVLALGLLLALGGFINMRADNPPSHVETALAGRSMDASVARAAPKATNPITADEANLVVGARLYREHCTLCHGDPAHPNHCSPIRSILLRRSS
jgi:mono/diheme cytochrome c family protein